MNKIQKSATVPIAETGNFIVQLKQIIQIARQKAYSAVNFAQIEANWLIGQQIVEQEQQGKKRAEYGKQIIKLASEELTKEFGKGFSATNLKNFKAFYVAFSDLPISQALPDLLVEKKSHTVPDQLKPTLPLLSWSHYERLLRVKDEKARKWYSQEAVKQMWSYRTLDRNIATLYYHRMLSSQETEQIEQEMKVNTAAFQQDTLEFIKNPTVLEFLGLSANKGYTEGALEQAIIDQMQTFILELGKGFAFVARQQLIRTETQDFYIDLVFYNYMLKCFVILELKTNKITHQDIGQLDMYVRMYDDLKKPAGDNPTIGILLCTETDNTIARYSVLKENKQLFASKYMPYLPTEEELKAEIERQKELLAMRKEADQQQKETL
ncbi:MAG: PDDEXK nuclease domain-containing protein [Spirochaetaceae bacterium]|jgi:predicted nuclease of restriction endonuclease-like (RecB) superfamily|nr:PDDEXK nuclease domain-containing protein [Spirochaetaceae bacterium]